MGGEMSGFTLGKRNRMRVCLGHYAVAKFGQPSRGYSRMTLEVTDKGASGILSSSHMDAVIDRIMPHPLRFRQVWNQQRGKQKLFAWKPVPPSHDFIALGMVATTTEDPPGRTVMRCVPRRWCCAAKKAPEFVWDDQGTGGRAGSIWT